MAAGSAAECSKLCYRYLWDSESVCACDEYLRKLSFARRKRHGGLISIKGSLVNLKGITIINKKLKL